MKKIISILFSILMTLSLAPALEGHVDNGYKGSFLYRTSGKRYYSSKYKYFNGSRRYYRKYERKILRKIRKNERLILKYEYKIRKLLRRRAYRGYYRYNYYSRRIRYFKSKINWLIQRNHYLKRLLR